MADKGMDHCANPHKRSVRQDEISSQYPCMGAQVSGSRHSGRSVREYLPPAPSFCKSAPHHLTHPSGLVSSSLFFQSHSRPLAAKPRPRLVDHTPRNYFSNRRRPWLLALSTCSIQRRTTKSPVARSFPGLTFQLSTYGRPTGFTENPRHTLSTVSLAAPPATHNLPCDIHLQLPGTSKFPCQILGQPCDTTCISVTTTADRQHLASGSCFASDPQQHKTSQTRVGEIDSSTPISKLAPIFEHQRASAGTLTTPSPNSDPAAGTRRKSSSSFWGSVMSSRKPSHYQTDSAHSAKIAVYSSTTDCDADDEATMSAEESSQQVRPMSVHMAASAPSSAASSTRPMSEAAPFCPRRPNLREILANTAPAPWTLAAFMAYLSNNHCLETLEFTMDAGRYKKHYHRMMNKAPVPGQPTETDANYVKELWDRLMEAYIQPNGSREVNLPSQVRDPILEHKPENRLPPAPTVLEPAVSKTYELMEESVLVPFLNSVYPQSPTPVSPYYPSNSNNSNESMTPVEEKSRFGRRSRHSSRGSPPPLSASSAEFSAASYSPPSLNNRKSAPSALTTALSRHRFSQKLSPTSSAPSHSLSAALSTASSASDAIYSGPGLTDDSGSSGSPINDCPMTPPVTPPMSDISGSPKTNRDSGAWKKLGRLSGWKPSRKRGQPGFDLHTT
ncbi:regulator of G protein signaling superfamily [Aureobasidium pullulans]|uniref:Regulator of G protein signaling superfamily n=1 Tax=Aureobasidium pullulans TaxID=5580 RepID=A0AB74JLY1_AURPU|nr:regulator of G protein signaling superfamily [Aureobasidium pullulans]THX24952.1 regulator of G protein signaling superfamily [Aureobasidium pullulans]THX37045.1 regulator of G protein signaling superfamily [Aureobasidium pullulans]THX80941.1 regulator of G protein signaling superfamily [Aureobasidium pullulans]